ncbi:hypothetical protein EDD80_1022 [Anseongella ginsenosidimutans]|uniref:Uncharacterized protein n=1 Tax=Anseongella ginsenosidimutans TaxID=496056 RepID=A0A4R3KXW2_9SPHI|nr:hypothetical protein EDD80_1022 [Anseongella ginsenosidimutans]
MNELFSISSKLINPAVILTDRAARIFLAILSGINNAILQIPNSLPIKLGVILSLKNFGGRMKERRKSRPGLRKR